MKPPEPFVIDLRRKNRTVLRKLGVARHHLSREQRAEARKRAREKRLTLGVSTNSNPSQ